MRSLYQWTVCKNLMGIDLGRVIPVIAVHCVFVSNFLHFLIFNHIKRIDFTYLIDTRRYSIPHPQSPLLPSFLSSYFPFYFNLC